MIQVSELAKSYKKNKAVDTISFKVYEGEILYILGSNGSGKAHTINMLIGAL